MARVVIVGGGISGLSLAYRLQKKSGVEVVVLERRDRAGGTLGTVRRDGFQFETGANGFLDLKTSTLDLCRDVGLGDDIVAASEAAGKHRYLFLDGKLQPLPGSVTSFLGTRLLSWTGKMSFLCERFRAGKTDGQDESIDSFARRRAGREAAEVFADAMVTGIFAGDPKLLSLPACFPRLASLEREHGSVLKGMATTAKQRRHAALARGEADRKPGKLWSLRGGLGTLIDALRDRLRTPPILGVAVRTVAKAGPRWLVHGEGQDRWEADAVVLACPAPKQASILAELDAELARKIAEIPYNAVVVVGLGYRRAEVPAPLDGFGFIAPQRTHRDVLGVQWCSSIYPGRAPDGSVLMRAMCGGWHRADMVQWPDERLFKAIRSELKLAMGIEAEPTFVEIARWPQAIPQYHVGHLARVAWIEERASRHPGLVLAGNAYHGVALNDCTEQATILAERIQKTLHV